MLLEKSDVDLLRRDILFSPVLCYYKWQLIYANPLSWKQVNNVTQAIPFVNLRVEAEQFHPVRLISDYFSLPNLYCN